MERSDMLEQELKKAMGYTEEIVRCDNCKYYSEDDGFIDRSWEPTCNYNKISKLSVKQHGRCDKFEKVEK